MANAIGPTFGAELTAAGVANGVSWDPATGVLTFDPNASPNYILRVNQVLAAHDPTATALPTLPKQTIVANMVKMGVIDSFATSLFSSTLTQQTLWHSYISCREDDPTMTAIMLAASPPIYPYNVFQLTPNLGG